MSRPSHTLRARLALALGLALLVPLTNAPDTAVATTTSEPSDAYCRPAAATTTTDTGAAPVGTDGSGGLPAPDCAPAGFVEVEAIGQAADGGCAVTALIGEGVYDPGTGSCCYPATTSCGGSGGSDKFVHCGCYGRPLVVAEQVVAAAPARRADWGAAGPRPVTSGLDADQRERLAAYWLDNARAEHSSVAGFARLVLDLLAVGAPAALVDRAQVAGADELRHARACYALAGAYAGVAWGPAGLRSAPIPLTGDLVALAVATAREGCVGETIAAHLAAELAARATDPAVRRVLTDIAREEADHAELSWAILSWALRVGGDPVRAAVAAVFADPPTLPADDTPADPALAAHGLVGAEEKARICEEGWREVVASVAGALLRAA
jgi:hypothetical protein